MKHRYIFCGVVWEDPCISNYRLISNTKYSHGQLVRVNIPDDLIIDHYNGDSYSITSDMRSIHDLGCDCYIMYNGKWRKFNWLKKIEPHQWFKVLEHIFGLMNCYDTIGWTDNVEYYKKWWWNEKLPSEDIKFPHLIEDKKGLTLQVKLDTNKSTIDWLRTGSGEDKWIKYYDEFNEQLKKNPEKIIYCS
jgi:hypothetical protein